jgi:RNA polymerase sigma factor (TIGR02999 family)
MDDAPSQPVTELLRAWSAGDEKALERLVPLVYGELRQLAQRRMLAENPGASLQPTALVNELYLRLAGAHSLSFHNRSQFFAVAAQMMRRILVDAARTRGALKRGGPTEKTPFVEGYFAAPGRDREVIALDDALAALAKEDSRKAQAVELRFFGGLSMEETADVMGISVQTVRRDWDFARVWLARAMHPSEQPAERSTR